MTTGALGAAIQAAVVSAMKQRQKERLGVLRMLQAQIKQVEIDHRTSLDDQGILKVMATYQRKVKESLASARDAGRDDLIAQSEAELAILAEFMPTEIGDGELEAIVRQAIASTGAAGPQAMGQVMKAVLPLVAGRADGGRVSNLVKRLLQG